MSSSGDALQQTCGKLPRLRPTRTIRLWLAARYESTASCDKLSSTQSKCGAHSSVPSELSLSTKRGADVCRRPKADWGLSSLMWTLPIKRMVARIVCKTFAIQV